jgi:endonuclease/exonuclease/phosphatase family metal-dependent hydrolase
LFAVVAAAALAGGAWYVASHFEIEGLERLRFTPREANTTGNVTALRAPSRNDETLRIASFNIQVFGESKANDPKVLGYLAEIVRQFDVVAVQEVRARNQDVVARLVDVVNTTGRQYDFVLGPRLGRTNSQEQYAFLYDSATLEVDRSELYVVNDPDDLLHREPFVAWFRVRGPAPELAFTFTLVNVHVDPDLVDHEIDVLADVFTSVRNDGRGEDDVILLGDVNANDHRFGRLGDLPGMAWAISGLPTNTRGDAQYDNLFFDQSATDEFTGLTGAFDFLREFNLSLDDALRVSDHLPVWAEFSIYEGGRPGRVAALPTP